MSKKKQYNMDATFAFFNQYAIETFDITFEKIRLAAVNTLYRHGLTYDQWRTLEDKKVTLKHAWDYDLSEKGVPFYFRRWWLDQIVTLLGIQVWNAVNKKHLDAWFNEGVLPETDLPKKLRNNPEAVASHLADAAENAFLAKFH